MKNRIGILFILLAVCSSLFAIDPWGEATILTESMTVMAQVSINGAPAAAGDVLGAFVSVGGTAQLRGKSTVMVIGGVPGCLLQIYTEINGEIINFKVWDESAQTVYDVSQTLTSEVNGSVGSYPGNLYQVNAGDSAQQVASPTFNPPAGSYDTAQNVTISCLTPGASIRYTIDGAEPGPGSPLYSVPLTIGSTTIVKAKGFLTGWTPSNTATALYTIGGTATDPWPEPQVLSGSMTVMAQVSINNLPAADGDILAAFVSVGGTEQIRGKTPVQVVSGVAGCLLQIFTESNGEVITFKVWDHSAQQSFTDINTLISEVNGSVGSYPNNLYQINAGGTVQQVALPIFNPAEGVYPTAQSVVITCATPGATIRFTTDGTFPSETSSAFSVPINISLSTTMTIRAKSFLTGWASSATATGVYTITGTVATPVFTPAAGTYTIAQNVTISCATGGAQIRYTTNGAEPTASSPLYSAPVTISSTRTLKAKAFLTGWNPSSTATGFYTITGMVATPVFTPAAGTYSTAQNVVINCATPGAEIRYTLDGAEPGASSTLYSAPVPIVATTTLKAKAFLTGWETSATATAVYTITGRVATPVFAPAAGTYTTAQDIAIACATGGAQIRYTMDGAEPGVASTLYTAAIHLDASATIKAKAFLADWEPSLTATAEYKVSVSNPEGPEIPVVTGIQEAYPNPFQTDLTLKLGVKEAHQNYHLRIYNLRGERVYQTQGNARGSFELTWDGRDQDGVRLAPGVYLVSFVTGKEQSRRKVVLR